MKIYAEFFEEGQNVFRKRTYLQFGSSWDLIGSAVLKNPGSAGQEKHQVSSEIFKKIKKFEDDINLSVKNWFQVSSDPTMSFLAKIFDGSYIGKSVELKGVIQLFNLFNIKDPNLISAKKKLSRSNSRYLYSDPTVIIKSFKDKPVFLGWGKEYSNKFVEKNAEEIFEYVVKEKWNYLEREIESNKFYHPQYINVKNKNEKIGILLNHFWKSSNFKSSI